MRHAHINDQREWIRLNCLGEHRLLGCRRIRIRSTATNISKMSPLARCLFRRISGPLPELGLVYSGRVLIRLNIKQLSARLILRYTADRRRLQHGADHQQLDAAWAHRDGSGPARSWC